MRRQYTSWKDDEIDFGMIIDAVRIEHRISRRVLANRVGISHCSCYNICTGLQHPTIYVAYRLCQELNLNMETVMAIANKHLKATDRISVMDAIKREARRMVIRDIPMWKKRIKEIEGRD